jgi:hypothetical protein
MPMRPETLLEECGVVVDEDGHELAVDDVHHDGAAGDDLVLVPAVVNCT